MPADFTHQGGISYRERVDVRSVDENVAIHDVSMMAGKCLSTGISKGPFISATLIAVSVINFTKLRFYILYKYSL